MATTDSAATRTARQLGVQVQTVPITTTDDQLEVGDIVRVVPGAEPRGTAGAHYRVESIPRGPRTTNYVLFPVTGGTGVRASRDLLERVSPADAARARLLAEAAPKLVLGSVVVFRVPRVATERGVFVVIKSAPTGVNLARLGGDGGHYFRTIRPAQLRLVPIGDDVHDQLAVDGS